jgi:pyruvate kinase
MRRRRDRQMLKTKIVATLGPPRVICDPQGNRTKEPVGYERMIPWFIEAGVDVLRLNMAFFKDAGDSVAQAVVAALDNLNPRLRQRVGLMIDLQGPKIRLGEIRGGKVSLKKDDRFTIRTQSHAQGDGKGASILLCDSPFVEMAESVSAALKGGDEALISIADGSVVLKAEKVTDDGGIVCFVKRGGDIKSRRGVTLRNVDLPKAACLDDDLKALEKGVEAFGEWLAFVSVSFVREAEDVERITHRLVELMIEKAAKAGGGGGHGETQDSWKQAWRYSPLVLAKIETQQGYDNIHSIMDAASGVMVARGDLALQSDMEIVPVKQKRLIKYCNYRGKPVITATQMLLSMTVHEEPTRAEVTDVFNAVLDGTDAVMLSDETADGEFPLQAIDMMGRIAEEAEVFEEGTGTDRYRAIVDGSSGLADDAIRRMTASVEEPAAGAGKSSSARREYSEWLEWFYTEKLRMAKLQPITDRISQSSCILSESPGCKAIIAATTSGRTARMVSRFHPKAIIVGAAHDIGNARKLALSRGVCPLNIGDGQRSPQEVYDDAVLKAATEGLIGAGDTIVHTAGSTLFEPGTTNLIQMRTIPRDLDNPLFPK